MLKSSRRGFLLGLLAMPAVVHAGNLMPISARNLQKEVLWEPCYELVTVDMYGNKGYIPIPGCYTYIAKHISKILDTRLADGILSLRPQGLSFSRKMLSREGIYQQ